MAKMFCTCRATVCSLMTSADAISRLLFPAATRRSTSSSRGVSPCVSRAPVGAAQRVDARQVGHCPELLEDAAGAFELERRRVLVAEHAARLRRRARGPARSRTGPRAPARPAQARRRETTAALGIALGELDRAPSLRDHGAEHPALVALPRSPRARRRTGARRRASPWASMISTKAGSSRARARAARWSRPASGGSRRRPRRLSPARAAAARDPAAAPSRTDSLPGTHPRRRRTPRCRRWSSPCR